jgi:hypothetical protein
MSGQNANAVHVKITGADGVPNSVVDCGTANPTPLPPSAGQPIAATKTSTGQIVATHGTVSGGGPIFDNPA